MQSFCQHHLIRWKQELNSTCINREGLVRKVGEHQEGVNSSPPFICDLQSCRPSAVWITIHMIDTKICKRDEFVPRLKAWPPARWSQILSVVSIQRGEMQLRFRQKRTTQQPDAACGGSEHGLTYTQHWGGRSKRNGGLSAPLRHSTFKRHCKP